MYVYNIAKDIEGGLAQTICVILCESYAIFDLIILMDLKLHRLLCFVQSYKLVYDGESDHRSMYNSLICISDLAKHACIIYLNILAKLEPHMNFANQDWIYANKNLNLATLQYVQKRQFEPADSWFHFLG